VFLAKELKEIVRTWRIWVLPAILIFLGVLSPVTAKLTPALVQSVTGDQPGVVLELPDPTTVDAYLQWTKNLVQIVLIAVIISTAGTIAGEKRSGTAILVLTKPVSRQAMVVAKVLGNLVLVIGGTVAGALACLGATAVLFEVSSVPEFAGATALWLVLAVLFLCVMTLLSVLIDSQAGAAGIGLVVYLALAVLNAWGPAKEYSPAGLLGAADAVATGQDVAVLWPVLTAVGASVAIVVAAAWAFRRVEL
jgi:ABC-2 type transport system permease protein